MKGSPVTADLNAVLNHLVGDMEEENEQTKTLLTDAQKAANYRRCTWWGGCYYCQNAAGSWELVYCIAKKVKAASAPKCAIVTPTQYTVSTNAYDGACVPVRSISLWENDRFAAELLFWRDDEAPSGLPVITQDSGGEFLAELLERDFEDIYRIMKEERNVDVVFQCDGEGGYTAIRVSGGNDVPKVHEVAGNIPKPRTAK